MQGFGHQDLNPNRLRFGVFCFFENSVELARQSPVRGSTRMQGRGNSCGIFGTLRLRPEQLALSSSSALGFKVEGIATFRVTPVVIPNPKAQTLSP